MKKLAFSIAKKQDKISAFAVSDRDDYFILYQSVLL